MILEEDENDTKMYFTVERKKLEKILLLCLITNRG